MKKLMILGAGSCQLNAIRKIKELGFIPVVSDYKTDSPGKKISDHHVLADTFSFEDSLKGAVDYNVDGVMTTGTDQPVLTASKIAEKLGLFSYLDVNTAHMVTNKALMKKRFNDLGIPSVDYQLVDGNTPIELDPPFVIKPIDSQGQRGIYKIHHKEEVGDFIKKSLSFSKEKMVLLEKFYENQEVTVSGWVTDEKLDVLMITDRVTFHSDDHIGVCISHEYPSIHQRHLNELEILSERICKGFEIKQGPIYFQFLIGQEGIKVNEIACRIGGAYEDMTIPYLNGVDILKTQIKHSLGQTYNYLRQENKGFFSTQLFFCHPGVISDMQALDLMKSKAYILDVGYNFKVGDTIGETHNASQRAGYMIVIGESEEDLVKNIDKAYDLLYINDQDKNLVIRGKRFYR